MHVYENDILQPHAKYQQQSTKCCNYFKYNVRAVPYLNVFCYTTVMFTSIYV